MATYPLRIGARETKYALRFVWEWPIRLTHWVTAASIVTLFTTGLYIASPFFTSNGEPYQHFVMGRFRQVHFVAGYALLFSFILRGYWFLKGNKYARSGVPLVWRASWWKNLREQIPVSCIAVGISVFVGIRHRNEIGNFPIVPGCPIFFRQATAALGKARIANPCGMFQNLSRSRIHRFRHCL